jgi:hypothetical protein
MRFASLALLVLVAGCASPSLPKPSPYHYGAVNTTLANPHRAAMQKTSHGR